MTQQQFCLKMMVSLSLNTTVPPIQCWIYKVYTEAKQYRKRRHHSPSTENRKRSHSISAEDKISQAEGAIKSLKRHTEKGTCPETLQHRARAGGGGGGGEVSPRKSVVRSP